MRSKISLFLLSLTALICQAGSIVARQDFNVSSAWRYPVIMGKDFWIVLPQTLSNNKDLSMLYHPFRNPEFQKVPVFRDAGITQGGYKKQKDLPERFVMKDLFYVKGNPWWRLLERYPKNDVPLLIFLNAERPLYRLKEKYVHDAGNYRDFLKKHPNFYMFMALREWDNMLVYYDGYLGPRTAADKAKYQKIYPFPKNRYQHLALAEKFFRRSQNFHFDDHSRFSAMRAGWSLDHVAAAFGARMIGLETTNTKRGHGGYRWQTSAYFIRGAARQFSVPWYWYTAHFYNGYTDKGEWKGHHLLSYIQRKDRHGTWGPTMGPSASNLKRVNFLAWLCGSSFHTIEAAPNALTVMNPKTKRLELSQIGRDYNELYLATKRIDRGIPYTPVAILTPFAQGYPQEGGLSWSRYEYEPGDLMIDAFTYSIVPPVPRIASMKKGIECTLFNTPFAASYDVLVPDSPQKTEDFVRALNNYKAAFLTGTYPAGKDLETALSCYVRNGGTLILNVMQLPGFFSTKFTGVKVDKSSLPAGRSIVDENGKKTALRDTYRLRRIIPVTARPWLKDEKGNVLATVLTVGKGRVIVTAPEWMTPPLKKVSRLNIMTGKQTFEFIKYLLERVQDETFPVKAAVPVQYGINKTKNGWLLWLINNKGVYKFVNKEAVVKPEERITVPVALKKLAGMKVTDALTGKRVPVVNGTVQVTVESGDIRLLTLTK